MAVNGINGISGFNAISPVLNEVNKVQDNEQKGISFGEYLKDALNKVNELQLESDRISEDFAAGKIDNIHEVTIAAEKASLALELTMQIRNKILDAYNEIMRMQI